MTVATHDSRPAAWRSLRYQAMGSPCILELHADAAEAELALTLAREETERLEAKYSRFREDSLLSRINCQAGKAAVCVDEETAGLLDFALRAHEQSQGLFDPSAGVLRKAWDFHSGRLPTPAQLQVLLPHIGLARLDWQRPWLRLPAGMELDFGGFVKEYAADAVAASLRRAGLQHGLVNLGGDIALLGPHPDGSPWQLGISHPRAPEQAIAQIPLQHGALASSGDYERFMIHQGQRYCHILNPRSGWPAQGLAAVSVVADQCLIAGVISTVAMLLSETAACRWLDDSGLPWLAITSDLRQLGAVAPRHH